jgi:hypothetical protein
MPGRPVKNNADYFSHDNDASQDPKLLYIESVHGLVGYAFYFKILECLTRADYFKIELSDINKAIYSKKIGISLADFDSILSTCIKVEALLIDENNCLYSAGLLKRMSLLISKRDYDRKRKENSAKETICPAENSIINGDIANIPQGKLTVKESKVKNSTEKESKEYCEETLQEIQKKQVKQKIKPVKIDTPKHELQIWIEENCHNVCRLKQQMSFSDCEKIISQNKDSPDIIYSVLEQMDNKPDLSKKYLNVYKTLNTWIKNYRQWSNNGNSSKNNRFDNTSSPGTNGNFQDPANAKYKYI